MPKNRTIINKSKRKKRLYIKPQVSFEKIEVFPY